MKKMAVFLLIAVIASLIGFVIHVFSVEWITSYVSTIMEGHEVAPSWDVRYIAALTSIEIGVGLTLVYALSHKALPAKSGVAKGFMVGVVLLMVQGSLIRQPLMDWVIGNPLSVVVIQDGVKWIIWLLMSMWVAVVYERFIVPKTR